MPDLDGAVRAMLDDSCGAWHDGCAIEDHANAIRMRAAIEAVLDRHKPVPGGVPNKPHLADCAVCMDVSPEVCSPVGYPCETVEDIAKALGVTDAQS